MCFAASGVGPKWMNKIGLYTQRPKLICESLQNTNVLINKNNKLIDANVLRTA